MTDTTLDGHGILVTGGGTGIGAACARALAASGAIVTICGRTESKLQATADVIDGDVRTIVCDVTDESQVLAAVEAAANAPAGLKGVVANAGGGGGMGPYHLQDTEEFLKVLHLNVLGTMLCIKHSVPKMRASGGGSFIGMSSIAGHQTHLWFGAYPAAKAGIEQMIRNAADEYGSANIRFNAIRPGFIATELMEGVPRDSEVYASYIDNTPLGDVGEPDDVGALARFLIGPESRWITGQCINIDGGHSLRRGPQFTQFFAGMGEDVLHGELPPG